MQLHHIEQEDDNITSNVGYWGRFINWYTNIPIVTKLLSVFLIFIYLLVMWSSVSYVTLCLEPVYILEHNQYYRILTYQFVHNDILHITLNVATLLCWLGPSLERNILGSLQFLYLNFIFVFFTSIIHFLLLSTETWIFSHSISNDCTIGFSAILFTYLSIHTNLSTSQNNFPFFFQLNNKLYPWLLLIFCQIIFPNASFLGHLSGIIVAQLYLLNLLNFAIISPSTLQNIESSSNPFLTFIISCSGYIVSPYLGLPIAPTPPPNVFNRFSNWFKHLFKKKNINNINNINNNDQSENIIVVSSNLQSISQVDT